MKINNRWETGEWIWSKIIRNILTGCMLCWMHVWLFFLMFWHGIFGLRADCFSRIRGFISSWYMGALLYIVPGYLMLYYLFQLYTPKRVRGRRLEAWNILQANTIGLMVFTFVLYIIEQANFPEKWSRFFSAWILWQRFLWEILCGIFCGICGSAVISENIWFDWIQPAAEQYIDRIKQIQSGDTPSGEFWMTISREEWNIRVSRWLVRLKSKDHPAAESFGWDCDHTWN